MKTTFRENIHLIISVLIVIPAALFYGLFPNKTLPILLDFEVHSRDLKNVFRAIMGLYLAFSGFWIVGIFQPKFWKAATISNCLFMLGLGFGRLFSIFLDGIPSSLFLVGTMGELILGFYGMYRLNKKNLIFFFGHVINCLIESRIFCGIKINFSIGFVY